MFAHALEIEFLSREYLDVALRYEDIAGGRAEQTCPSDFRLTLRMIPKEPFPMISRESYCSRNELMPGNVSHES